MIPAINKCEIHNEYLPCIRCQIEIVEVKNQDKQTFKSGATSSGQVPGYDMLPELFLTRVAKRFDLGKEKHGKFNYRKGLQDKEFIIDRLNHAFLHLKRAIDLIENNTPFEDDNLAAVAVNVAMAMEFEYINHLDRGSDPLFIAMKKGQELGGMKMPGNWPKE